MMVRNDSAVILSGREQLLYDYSLDEPTGHDCTVPGLLVCMIVAPGPVPRLYITYF
jgi:hypothetical protein